MSRWPGGLIRKTAITPAGPYQDGAAKGVWTIMEAAYWIKQGLWPLAGNTLQRGLFAKTDDINYISIPSTGNGIDFGNLSPSMSQTDGCSSSTRGIFGTDYDTPTNIAYVTIATLGNSIVFGNLAERTRNVSACSNETRGIWAGGATPSGRINTIQYVTIATTGNATDFGDLTVARSNLAGCSSLVRGVFGGGDTGSNSNVMDYITITTTGNAIDFGDLTLTAVSASNAVGACSNCHGGL